MNNFSVNIKPIFSNVFRVRNLYCSNAICSCCYSFVYNKKIS